MTPSPTDPLFCMMVRSNQRAQAQRDLEELTRQDKLVLTLLERLDDDIQCQFDHTQTLCTHTVTHRATACIGSWLFCDVAAESGRRRIQDTITRCAKCNKLAADCWKVYPV